MPSNCSDIVYKYEKLQKEKKQMVLEYNEYKLNDNLSDETLQDHEDRILDISFQIDDTYQQLIICNGGKTRTSNF